MNEEHESQSGDTPEAGLSINVHDDIPITERLGWKKIVAGQKKLAAWGHGRDDEDRDTGRPTWKELRFDREADRYTETVTVKATGEVIIKKDYPLSEKGKRKRQGDLSKPMADQEKGRSFPPAQRPRPA